MSDFDPNKTQTDETQSIPVDLFSDEDEPVSATDKKAVEALSKEFSFDRYGRRQFTPSDKPKKRRKERYGKRKDMPKAETLVVVKDTAAKKDIEEAERRAQIRDAQRKKALEKELQKKRRHQMMQLKRRLTVIGMILALVFILAIAAYFIFRLSSIKVIGTFNRYTQTQIVEISKLTVGKHMLQQDLSEAEELLENDPYISATVDYVFPNSVQIMIVERVEAAAVRWGLNNNYIAIIDREGVVLNDNSVDTHGLIEVNGLVLTGAVSKQRIGEQTDEQVSDLLSLLSKIQEYGLNDLIDSVDMTETMGIVLFTNEGYRIEVGGTSDLDTKFTRLKSNWAKIIQTAAKYVSDGFPNPTVYLYSKNGVTISPYEPDYVVPSQSPEPSPNAPLDPNASPDPNVSPDPNTSPDPNVSPGSTPAGQTTPIPFISDPFYG